MRRLFIVVSSDKGLCGGIHSSVSKATRRAISNATDSPFATAEGSSSVTIESDSPVMVIGDKSKMQLIRALPQNLVLTFNQIGRDIPTFADAAGVADLIIKSGVKYDSVVLVYNKFVSALSYEAAIMEVKGAEALKESGMTSFLNHSSGYLTNVYPSQTDSRLTRWRTTSLVTSLNSR